jgi:hypothetical protein
MTISRSLSEPVWAPDACTLPSPERPLRVAQFDELFGTATAAERPEPTRLQLTLPPEPETAARAAGLVAREVQCCSFFTFTLTIRSDSLRLLVEAPPEHVDVLDAVTARVRSARVPVVRER